MGLDFQDHIRLGLHVHITSSSSSMTISRLLSSKLVLVACHTSVGSDQSLHNSSRSRLCSNTSEISFSLKTPSSTATITSHLWTNPPFQLFTARINSSTVPYSEKIGEEILQQSPYSAPWPTPIPGPNPKLRARSGNYKLLPSPAYADYTDHIQS